MLILLPPSEGKATLSSGDDHDEPVLDLDQLSFPSLNPARSRVLDTVVRLSRGPKAKARARLGLSPRQDAELLRNGRLWESPTRPAGEIYTGVLYEAMARGTLSAAARLRLDGSVVVVSALFGAVRLTDPIPAYRLSADVSLPRLGRLATWWRQPLDDALPDVAADVVFDLRSSSYSTMWTPSGDVADRTIVGRVLHRRPDGSVQVVSHFNKATKGRLVAGLAKRRTLPRSPQQLIDAVTELGYGATLVAMPAGRANRLDLVVDEL